MGLQTDAKNRFPGLSEQLKKQLPLIRELSYEARLPRQSLPAILRSRMPGGACKSRSAVWSVYVEKKRVSQGSRFFPINIP